MSHLDSRRTGMDDRKEYSGRQTYALMAFFLYFIWLNTNGVHIDETKNIKKIVYQNHSSIRCIGGYYHYAQCHRFRDDTDA